MPRAGIAQLVERNLAKVEVASSSLVSRSMFEPMFCADLELLEPVDKSQWGNTGPRTGSMLRACAGSRLIWVQTPFDTFDFALHDG